MTLGTQGVIGDCAKELDHTGVAGLITGQFNQDVLIIVNPEWRNDGGGRFAADIRSWQECNRKWNRPGNPQVLEIISTRPPAKCIAGDNEVGVTSGDTADDGSIAG